jgi:plasmid stability protein
MNISIKNVPDELVQLLRQRAARNHRSVQGELVSILEETLIPKQPTVEEVYLKAKTLGLKPTDNATSMIREDRDAR